jgi:hypothetical protein
MKKIIHLFLFIVVCNCNSQNKKENLAEKIKINHMTNQEDYNKLIDKSFEKFDKESFYKDNKEGLPKSYILSNNFQIEESAGDNGNWFLRAITKKESLFTVYKSYDYTGKIKAKRINLFKNSCLIGIRYEFDENGKLINEINEDKPFNISVFDIIEFLKKNKADLFDVTTNVNRYYDEKSKKATWTLSYRGLYKTHEGKLRVEIDDESTDVISVIRITGKRGEKEIIFKK